MEESSNRSSQSVNGPLDEPKSTPPSILISKENPNDNAKVATSGKDVSSNPWSKGNLTAGIFVGVISTLIATYILQDARFDPTRQPIPAVSTVPPAANATPVTRTTLTTFTSTSRLTESEVDTMTPSARTVRWMHNLGAGFWGEGSHRYAIRLNCEGEQEMFEEKRIFKVVSEATDLRLRQVYLQPGGVYDHPYYEFPDEDGFEKIGSHVATELSVYRIFPTVSEAAHAWDNCHAAYSLDGGKFQDLSVVKTDDINGIKSISRGYGAR